jgi:hypothetical protein
MLEPMRFVVSGEVFSYRFMQYHVGWHLDQGTVQKAYLIFTVLFLVLGPYLGVFRWFSARHTRLGYWTFVLPALAICFCITIGFICAVVSLVKYVAAMGWTPMRVWGFIYSVAAGGSLLALVMWIVWPPEKGGQSPTSPGSRAC